MMNSYQNEESYSNKVSYFRKVNPKFPVLVTFPNLKRPYFSSHFEVFVGALGHKTKALAQILTLNPSRTY